MLAPAAFGCPGGVGSNGEMRTKTVPTRFRDTTMRPDGCPLVITHRRRFSSSNEVGWSVPDDGGRCPMGQLAAVISELLGFERPLMRDIDERRDETVQRFCLGGRA